MTSKNLIENGFIWKNKSGSWSRYCPQCSGTIDHICSSDRRAKDVCRRSHLKKKTCRNCRAINQKGVELKPVPEGIWENDSGYWCRICHQCGITIVHKGKNRNNNKKKCASLQRSNSPCFSCNATANDRLKKSKSAWASKHCWTQEEEAILLSEGSNELLHDLAKMLPRHTTKAIRTKRYRLGVKLTDEYISRVGTHNRSLLDPDKLCKLDQSWTLDDLTSTEFQTLIGCQLGDGSIKKNGQAKPKNDGSHVQRNYTFYCSHNYPCGDYTDWKIKILNRFAPRRWANDIRTEMITPSHPIFTKLRGKFYTRPYLCDKDIIPMDLVEQLDLFGLMIWYLDDGYLGVPQDGLINNARNLNGPKWHKKPSPHIVAKGYKYNELVEVCNIFNNKFGLHLNVGTSKHRDGINKFINIPASDRTLVLEQWRKLAKQHDLPKSMWYKLNMHDPKLLKWELQENVRKFI